MRHRGNMLNGTSPLGSVLKGLPCEVLVRVADALRFWNSLSKKVSLGHSKHENDWRSLLIREPILQQDGIFM